MVATTLLNTPMKPELVPMMMGTLPPQGPMPYNWIKVTIPAIIIAFCSRLICKLTKSVPPIMPHAPPIIKSGVRLPTNMAKTCCRPKGIAWPRGISPSKL